MGSSGAASQSGRTCLRPVLGWGVILPLAGGLLQTWSAIRKGARWAEGRTPLRNKRPDLGSLLPTLLQVWGLTSFRRPPS